MSRGRHPNAYRSVEWTVNIPETIAAKVALILHDPVRGKPAHGARSALITQLLTEWLRTHDVNPEVPQ